MVGMAHAMIQHLPGQAQNFAGTILIVREVSELAVGRLHVKQQRRQAAIEMRKTGSGPS